MSPATLPEVYRTRVEDTAREYRTANHEPQHASYSAFIAETLAQFDYLYKRDWTFETVIHPPYANSASMFADCTRKHLYIYTGGNLKRDNPMGNLADFLITEYGRVRNITVNEAFRAVHDVFGHYNGLMTGLRKEPFHTSMLPFETFEGELEAYRNHARMYSAESIPALYSETIGQLCHYYAGYGFVSPQANKVIEVRSW